MPPSPSSSDCATFAPLLPLVADGAVTPATAAARAHMRECVHCQQAIGDYQHIDAAVRRYYAIVTPLPLPLEDIMDFIADHTPDPTPNIATSPPPLIRRRWSRMISAAIITCLVIILVTGFAITRWHTQLIASPPSPSNLVLNSVSMISPDEGWAVGDGYNANWDLNLPNTWKSSTLYHYQHGVWRPTPLAAPLVIAVHLLRLHMLSATDGWALGDAVVKPGASRQMVMHYDGVTWSPVADAGQILPDQINDFGRYTELQVISDHSVWVSTFDLSNSAQETKLPAVGHIIDGHIWKIEYLPLPYQAANINLVVTALAMVNDDEGWLAALVSLPSSDGPGTGETLLYHRIHGSWVIDTILHDDTAYFTHMTMTPARDGWVLGQQSDAATHRPIPLLYHYAQNKWSPFASGITTTSGDDTLFTMLTPQDGWMLINGPQIEAYHYDGTRWTLTQQIPTANLGAVTFMEASFSSSADGWVVGNRALYPSKDTGYYYPLYLHYTQGKWSVYP